MGIFIPFLGSNCNKVGNYWKFSGTWGICSSSQIWTRSDKGAEALAVLVVTQTPTQTSFVPQRKRECSSRDLTGPFLTVPFYFLLTAAPAAYGSPR